MESAASPNNRLSHRVPVINCKGTSERKQRKLDSQLRLNLPLSRNVLGLDGFGGRGGCLCYGGELCPIGRIVVDGGDAGNNVLEDRICEKSREMIFCADYCNIYQSTQFSPS